MRRHHRIAREHRHDRAARTTRKIAPSDAEEHRVVAAGRPHRRLGPLGLARAQRLPDHRRRRVAQAPRGQNREQQDRGCRSCSRPAHRCRRSRSRAPVRSSSRCRSAPGERRRRSTGTPSTSRWARREDGAARPQSRLRPLQEHPELDHTAVPRPMFVATAAPVTPSSGNGPSPKIRQGSSTRLMALADHQHPHRDRRVARAPEDRVARNSSVTVALPPSITTV